MPDLLELRFCWAGKADWQNWKEGTKKEVSLRIINGDVFERKTERRWKH